MDNIRKMWSNDLPEIPEDELKAIGNTVPEKYRDLCSCFWLFRMLHEVQSPEATLMGDYCFGRFSNHLSKIDSVSLTNAFSSWLQSDILSRKTMEDYLAFAAGIPEIVNGYQQNHK